MHDFVSYLFYLLQRGMRFAVPAALICGLILAVCYAVCRKKGRRFPWGKAVCAVLLVGWAAVTVFVTLLRSEPNEFAARQCNLQLFLAWREAYQRFTLQIWLNVLLNIALFVPLGVLLPLLWKPFRKWYAALGAGFGVSLLIELAQLLTARGMCDVDDLFTNTLGAMLGWCAAMLVLALHQKSRTWPRYCALPAAFALALSAIFISYAAQPYGNLRDASRHDGGPERRPLVGRLCARRRQQNLLGLSGTGARQRGRRPLRRGICRRARRRISGCVLLR